MKIEKAGFATFSNKLEFRGYFTARIGIIAVECLSRDTARKFREKRHSNVGSRFFG